MVISDDKGNLWHSSGRQDAVATIDMSRDCTGTSRITVAGRPLAGA